MGFLKELFHECFTTQGRMNRQRYFLYPIFFGICLIIPFLLVYFLINYFFGSDIADLLILLVIPFSLVLAYVQILAPIKRCRDLGYSGWMSLILFVPLVGFIFQIYLWFAKGDEGSNEYGPDRLQEKSAQKLQTTENQVL